MQVGWEASAARAQTAALRPLKQNKGRDRCFFTESKLVKFYKKYSD